MGTRVDGSPSMAPERLGPDATGTSRWDEAPLVLDPDGDGQPRARPRPTPARIVITVGATIAAVAGLLVLGRAVEPPPLPEPRLDSAAALSPGQSWLLREGADPRVLVASRGLRAGLGQWASSGNLPDRVLIGASVRVRNTDERPWTLTPVGLASATDGPIELSDPQAYGDLPGRVVGQTAPAPVDPGPQEVPAGGVVTFGVAAWLTCDRWLEPQQDLAVVVDVRGTRALGDVSSPVLRREVPMEASAADELRTLMLTWCGTYTLAGRVTAQLDSASGSVVGKVIVSYRIVNDSPFFLRYGVIGPPSGLEAESERLIGPTNVVRPQSSTKVLTIARTTGCGGTRPSMGDLVAWAPIEQPGFPSEVWTDGPAFVPLVLSPTDAQRYTAALRDAGCPDGAVS